MKLVNWFLCCVVTGLVLVLPGCGKKKAEAPAKNPEPMMLLPPEPAAPKAGAKERAKRANCVSNLRQLGLATHIYALDNQDKVFFGIRDGGDSFLLSISTLMYQSISKTYGDKVFDCPNLYPFTLPGITDNPKGRYQSGTGYYIGYYQFTIQL